MFVITYVPLQSIYNKLVFWDKQCSEHTYYGFCGAVCTDPFASKRHWN